MENCKAVKSNKKTAVKVITAVLVVILVFLGVFFLYDSPAEYVTTKDGSIYLNSGGKPTLYYKDLFGNEFYEENGKRVYAAVPQYVDTTPITTAAATDNIPS